MNDNRPPKVPSDFDETKVAAMRSGLLFWRKDQDALVGIQVDGQV
jgi:hypothetical protein